MARTQEIPREEWHNFFQLFSRQHKKWLITFRDKVISIRHQPLNEIRMDDGQIVVSAGDHKLVIAKPVSVLLLSTDEGADDSIEITTESDKTLIIIDNPMLPEMVDGIP